MTEYRDRQPAMQGRAVRWLLVMLTLAVASVGAVVGCSTEARYKIKTVIFTGVPPLDETATDTVSQEQVPQSPVDEQLARQQRHREALVSQYWQHGPFAAGECGRCHSLGQSKSFLGNRDATNQAPTSTTAVSASSRLTMPTQELCVSCHTQHGAEFARDRGLQQHLPVAAGLCTGCHNPHQSLRQYMLLMADNIALCSGCHDPTALSAVHAESPQRDCIECHNAHVGMTRKLLGSDAGELALLYGGGNDE